MKAFFIIFILSCYYRHVWGAPSEVNNEYNVKHLLPKSLLESIHQPMPQRKGRILNGLQYVQHSPGAHSIYLPHTTSMITNAYDPTDSIQAPINTSEQQIVDLQVPTSADANRILLRLPTQQLPVQRSYGIPPPRRHYRITLVRSRKPATPSPQLQSPEIEEKTLIYVLVKKPDESAAAAQIEELQKSDQNSVKHHAPEVYFIKYKESHASNPPPPSSYMSSTNGQTLQSNDAIN